MATVTRDLYKTLGVNPDADTSTLRKAYRKLARRHHPDVSEQPGAHDRMALINLAFETLIDPHRRAEYDATASGNGSTAHHATRAPRKPIVVRLASLLRGHRTPVYAVAFTPKGEVVSASFNSEIIWWDAATPKVDHRMRLDSGAVSALCPLKGGAVVAAGSVENTIGLWELNQGVIGSWRSSEEAWVSCVSISGDGQSVAAGSIHKAFSVYATSTGERRWRKTDHKESVTAVAWSRDARFVASGSADATVNLYGSDGKLIRVFPQIRSTVTALAFSLDNRFLAVAAVDLSIRVFDVETGIIQKMLFGHDKPIESLAFHSNGWLLASGARDGKVGLWNCAKGLGNVLLEASHRPVASVVFSPNGKRLAAGGQDKLVRVWDLTVKDSAG